MEMNKQPLEYEAIPQEHSIPLEYPQYIPTPKKKKKGVNPMLMYVFSGFMVLYIMFAYLFPGQTTQREPEPIIPDIQQPIPTVQDGETFASFEDTFELATKFFLEDDYVGATLTICDDIYEKYTSHNATSLNGTAMAFENGAFTQFTDQELEGDGGAYLWVEEITTYYWDDKEMTYFPESNFSVWLLRLTGYTAGNPQLKILQITMPTNNLIYGYVQASASYMETTLDMFNNADNAFLQKFYVYRDEYGASADTVRDGYVISSNERIEGPLKNLKFAGQITYKTENITLSSDKTHLAQQEEYANYGWYYMLNDQGMLDGDAEQYEDLTGLDESSNAFANRWDAAIDNPRVYGIRYVSGGMEILYLKNTANAENQWDYHVYNYLMQEESFPLGEILTPWLVIRSYI